MKILVFVYNADSRFKYFINRRLYISPSTTACKLHDIIHGRILIKRVWREFIESLSYHKVYFYSKDFKRAHPEYMYLELPSVLLKSEFGMNVLVTATEINSIENTDECIGLIGQKLSGF